MSKSVPQKDPSRIDVDGIKKMLKEECETCNIFERIGKRTRCSDCTFTPSSGKANKSGYCVALTAKFYKPFGLTTMSKTRTALGRAHLYMYLHHPSLNWTPPPIPDFDRFGNVVDKAKARFDLAHLDGNEHNNRKNNLFWMLKNEHTTTEKNSKRKKK